MTRTTGWRRTLGLDQNAPLPVARLGTIALTAGCLAGAFLYASGWLSPARISPATVADALQANTGRIYPGTRRAHAKGVCVAGRFDSNGQGQALSTALVFRPGATPVIGRVSVGGGNPMAPDGRVVFHALALEYRLADGTQWRTAMDDTPIFPVSNAAAFVALQAATTPDPATQKPDPAKLKPYLAAHPETRRFLDWMKQAPLPSSFANSDYNSIDAFRFTNAAGQVHLVRWTLRPDAPRGEVDKATLARLDPDFLFKDLVARIEQGPQTWHLLLTIAGPGDITDDATIAWPATNRQVDAGVLTLDRVASETVAAGGPDNCRDVNFDPLVLPAGIAASDDPLLPVRSSVYAASYLRRAAETPPARPPVSSATLAQEAAQEAAQQAAQQAAPGAAP